MTWNADERFSFPKRSRTASGANMSDLTRGWKYTGESLPLKSICVFEAAMAYHDPWAEDDDAETEDRVVNFREFLVQNLYCIPILSILSDDDCQVKREREAKSATIMLIDARKNMFVPMDSGEVRTE